MLRALQSLGASAAFAVAYGVVADVCVPAERGRMLGPVSAGLNLGACIGPVVGGWVAWAERGYGGVFWCLVGVAGTLLIAVGGFLPETARNVVGDGSVGVGRWWGRTWWSVLWDWSSRRKGKVGAVERAAAVVAAAADYDVLAVGKRRFKVRNPLACLRIIFWKDTALVLWMHASFYMIDYSVQTTIPSTYQDLYHFNELEIGLSYLPRGAGIILGGFLNGKMMDRNYKITAREIGHTIDRVSGDNLDLFPIEKARTRGSWFLLGISTCTLIAYGWVLKRKVNVSIPLILQFIHGFLGTCIYTIFNTLLVDIFPQSPSTAAAAASITRCALAAAGVAFLQPLLDTLGRGWYFTVLGVVSGAVGSAAVWAIQAHAMEWRSQRRAKTTKARGDFEAGPNDQVRNLEGNSKEPVLLTSENAAAIDQQKPVKDLRASMDVVELCAKHEA